MQSMQIKKYPQAADTKHAFWTRTISLLTPLKQRIGNGEFNVGKPTELLFLVV